MIISLKNSLEKLEADSVCNFSRSLGLMEMTSSQSEIKDTVATALSRLISHRPGSQGSCTEWPQPPMRYLKTL